VGGDGGLTGCFLFFFFFCIRPLRVVLRNEHKVCCASLKVFAERDGPLSVRWSSSSPVSSLLDLRIRCERETHGCSLEIARKKIQNPKHSRAMQTQAATAKGKYTQLSARQNTFLVARTLLNIWLQHGRKPAASLSASEHNEVVLDQLSSSNMCH
jgi:hypothetical protein